MAIETLKPFRDDGSLNVVVESPRGSAVKLKWDAKAGVMTLSRPLPTGLIYPFDWGFIPGTREPDGDPLDAALLWDCASYPGVVVACRAVAILRVEQNNRDTGAREPNDRLIVVPEAAARSSGITSVADIAPRVREEIEHFLTAVVAFERKGLKLLGWGNADEARAAVRAAAAKV